MKRFLLTWVVLAILGAIAGNLVAVQLFRRADLRYPTILSLVVVPALQAALVVLLGGASLTPFISGVRQALRDPLGRALVAAEVLVLALASASSVWIWTSALAAAAGVGLVAKGLRRAAPSLAIAGALLVLLAVDPHWSWHAGLADLVMGWAPPFHRRVVVYGGLVVIVFVAVLRAAARLDTVAHALLQGAVALAFGAVLVAIGNGILRPYFTPPWALAARTLVALSALLVALAVVAGRGRALLVLARDALAAAVLLAALVPIWLLPWTAAGRLGRAAGRLVGRVWPTARRTAAINLRRAYGDDMSPEKAATWTSEVFAQLGQSIAEGVQFVRRHRGGRGDWERRYRAEDPALEARILADPRPKVFVSGHLGSWEVALMLAACRFGERGGAVARRVDNPFVHALVRRLRSGDGRQWIEKAGAVAEARRRLEAGEPVALLLDENGGYRGVHVPFFGRPASTSKMAALLSLTTGAPIVVGAAVRRGDGPFLYRLHLLDPPAEGLSGPDAIVPLTARVVAVWEHWVREDPCQWRWIHWRWKTRPDGSEETYTEDDVRACFAAGGAHAVLERA